MKGWTLRLYVCAHRLLSRLGLMLPGKIMYIGGERYPAAPPDPG